MRFCHCPFLQAHSALVISRKEAFDDADCRMQSRSWQSLWYEIGMQSRRCMVSSLSCKLSPSAYRYSTSKSSLQLFFCCLPWLSSCSSWHLPPVLQCCSGPLTAGAKQDTSITSGSHASHTVLQTLKSTQAMADAMRGATKVQ